jgi:hypothetical protein
MQHQLAANIYHISVPLPDTVYIYRPSSDKTDITSPSL